MRLNMTVLFNASGQLWALPLAFYEVDQLANCGYGHCNAAVDLDIADFFDGNCQFDGVDAVDAEVAKAVILPVESISIRLVSR
jgi:hypothetical protein